MKGLLRNDGFELAGYIAFNTLLALFPFLIFLFALSGLVSSYDTAGMVLEFLFRLAPKNVGDTLAPVIVEVLSQPRGGLLTIGLLFAIWAASSGVDALRLSLNRAYSITEERSIWRLKLQSILLYLSAAASSSLSRSSSCSGRSYGMLSGVCFFCRSTTSKHGFSAGMHSAPFSSVSPRACCIFFCR